MFTIDLAKGIAATVNADIVPVTIEKFEKLSAEDQLALIWFAYHEIGKTITIVTPTPASMLLAQPLLHQIEQLAELEQLQVLCDLANRSDTPICRSYAAFTPNIKLGFWYQLGQWMDAGMMASIPRNYRLSQAAITVLISIQSLDAGQQIAVLRHMVIGMGYDDNELSMSIAKPVLVSPRLTKTQQSPEAIEGVTNITVLNYVDRLNAHDFAAVAELFARDGALQPPFQKPIVGKEQVLQYLQAECQQLKLLPDRGFVSYQDDRLTRIRVTGRVQTPWFGTSVGLHIAWRFSLDADDKIFFVAVDLLAAPSELVTLMR